MKLAIVDDNEIEQEIILNTLMLIIKKVGFLLKSKVFQTEILS